MDASQLSLLGIGVTVALYIFFILRGINVYLLSAAATALVAIFSGMDVLKVLSGPFMTAFVGFLKSYFLIFVSSALFGRFVSDAGIAYSLGKRLADAAKRSKNQQILLAALTIPLLNSILTYSGVSLFVTAFTLMYIARDLFKELDIPWHFYGFSILGSATFTMGMLPGSPQIQNLLPIKYFGSNPMSAPILGFAMAVITVSLALTYITFAVKRSKANNEHYIDTAKWIEAYIATSGGNQTHDRTVHPMWKCLIPLAIPIIIMNVLKQDAVYALLAGTLVTYFLFRSEFTNLIKSINEGTINGFNPILSICSAVGFGGAIAVAPGFKLFLSVLGSMPGSPMLHMIVAIAIASGITGSATAGTTIALNALGGQIAPLVDAAVAHRLAASSGFFSLLPHNGGIFNLVTIIRVKISDVYLHYFIIGLLIPGIAVFAGLFLSNLGIK